MTYINIFWWLVRIIGLLIVPIIFYDIEVFFLVFSLVYLHVKFGIQSILLDYVHNRVLFETFLLFLRLLGLEVITLLFEFFL